MFQMFHLNKIKYLLLLLTFVLLIPSVNALIKPTKDFYVNDYANILSQETEDYIINKSKALNQVDGTQIVVATVNDLEGYSIEEYSLNVARNFGIGNKEKNNGLLILIAKEEREIRIEVGYGLEGILPDGKVGRYRDQYMIPYLKNSDWDNGIKNGYDAFYSEIVKQNNLDVDYNEPVSNTNVDDNFIEIIFMTCIFSFIIGSIINSFSKKNTKKYPAIILYLCALVISYFVFIKIVGILIICILNFIAFIFGILGVHFNSGSSHSSGGRSSSSWSSGGGGSFGGGGASGKF